MIYGGPTCTCRCPTCDDDSGHVVLTSPECLLILYRSGISAIDTSIVHFQTCPRHRDDLGVYWKRPKRTYRSPSHPATSYAKCSRGTKASTCKHFFQLQHIKILSIANLYIYYKNEKDLHKNM